MTVHAHRGALRSAAWSPGGLLVVTAAVLAACVQVGQTSRASGPPSPLPVRSPASSAPLIATDAGLTLTVSFDSLEVAPGGTVTAHVTVTNGRSSAVVYGRQWCNAPATMTALVGLPREPAGRTWPGIAGTFKQYVLTQATGAGGILATEPLQIVSPSAGCYPPTDDGTLAAGARLTTTVTWKAEIAASVVAGPGLVPLTITFDHDPLPRPPMPTSQPSPSRFQLGYTYVPSYHELTVSASLRIAGDAPKVVSAGEAIDALLANHGFATWLAQQPATAWTNANLFLESYPTAEGIIPAGPAWEIELIRYPTDFAFGFVDPFTGVVRSIDYCNIPCSR